MVDNPNEASSSGSWKTTQEGPASDQQAAAPSGTLASKVVSLPELAVENEETKGLGSIEEPQKVMGLEDDIAPQPDATSKDIEEGKSAYRLGGFHPVYIGDVFNDRYKILDKIGYGQYSTVWLVKDLQVM